MNGSAGVGKTGLQMRFVQRVFDPVKLRTVICEFRTRVKIFGEEVTWLQLWDPSGQERFMNALPRAFYRGAILVFDLTRRETFEQAEGWRQDSLLFETAPVRALVGNKSDLSAVRQVSEEEAREYARMNGFLYFETSALTGVNVDLVFLEVARLVYWHDLSSMLAARGIDSSELAAVAERVPSVDLESVPSLTASELESRLGLSPDTALRMRQVLSERAAIVATQQAALARAGTT